MTQPETKTAQAIRHYQAGDVQKALAIAKGFRLGLTLDEHKAIVTAYECIVHPAFYRQLGTNTQAAVEAGRRVFEERIMK